MNLILRTEGALCNINSSLWRIRCIIISSSLGWWSRVSWIGKCLIAICSMTQVLVCRWINAHDRTLIPSWVNVAAEVVEVLVRGRSTKWMNLLALFHWFFHLFVFVQINGLSFMAKRLMNHYIFVGVWLLSWLILIHLLDNVPENLYFFILLIQFCGHSLAVWIHFGFYWALVHAGLLVWFFDHNVRIFASKRMTSTPGCIFILDIKPGIPFRRLQWTHVTQLIRW